MLNIDPDVHMRGAPVVPSVVGSARPQVSAATEVSPSPGGSNSGDPSGSAPPASGSVYPAGLVPGPLQASLITPGAISAARPWSSSIASGKGSIVSSDLPAPWTGGSSTVSVSLYLPPGYDASTTKYPVIYTAPESDTYWNRGMRLRDVLDAMITSGQIPPEIVVFASSFGGPYVDSECADSVDGHEWFDRFLATDLVHWVDATYRTIQTPAARATLGFSQGAYCAAAIVAHHPGVFGSAMVVSGYFVSGLTSGTTPNAWRPFNGNPAAEAAASPMSVIARLPMPVAASLFYVMEADPNNPVYGPQMAQFSNVLHGVGASLAVIPTPLGHSWSAARTIIPVMLTMVAGRMVHLGVFGTGS